MLSVILFGKNDNHGYNYPKRLAISLNSIAEMLTEDNDEIIFVDDGSPFDFPTVIEAVFDTLSQKALRRLKVFRTRDRHSTPPRESLSRNLGIRHSNPANHWILSTNIDMLFVPIDEKASLSSLIKELSDGFYQLPRFELPENFWECHFDRKDPQKNFSFILEKRSCFSLETIVRRPSFLGFDNPGDFQLMPRKAIFEMSGFHEGMTSGWHVDANLAKRMSLYFKKAPQSLENQLRGYHCNHTRQMSHYHKQRSSENSWTTFVARVKTPYLSDQENQWGTVLCEQISLQQKDLFYPIPYQRSAHDFSLKRESFNTLTYRSEVIIPHLVDHFHHLPPDALIGYVGLNTTLSHYLERSFPLIKPSDYPSFESFCQASFLIIFDFGFEEKQSPITPSSPNYFSYRKKLKPTMDKFLKTIRNEKHKKEKKKLIGINVLFTDFQALFHRNLTLYKTTPFTGIAMGYARDRRNSFGKWNKKEARFLLMDLALRHFYSGTDRLRTLAYKTPILHKLVQHK